VTGAAGARPGDDRPVALVVIPARAGATRLPGKPLLAETGTPLVVHCLRAARAARRAARVVVATDDARIAAAVRADGGEAVMTSPACRTGTDRVAEAAAALPGEDLVVNLQGDEPEFEPGYLDALVAAMEADPSAPMGTLAAPLDPAGDLERPSAVKVVTDLAGNALYFSRAAIPFPREPGGAAPLRHLGVYAFRRAALLSFASLPQGDLERSEALEQLRALENGWRIKVVRVPRAVPGVDTREDYDAFVARWRAAGAGRG
jgi:3-deoxy-manno-octulosonate cytidylyltransferase (CMP-KDO synthetase)